MKLPYKVEDEIAAAQKESLTAAGIEPGEEERQIIARERAMQYGLILGNHLRLPSVSSAEIEAIMRALLDPMANQAPLKGHEDPLAEAMIKARAEFRDLLGLKQI